MNNDSTLTANVSGRYFCFLFFCCKNNTTNPIRIRIYVNLDGTYYQETYFMAYSGHARYWVTLFIDRGLSKNAILSFYITTAAAIANVTYGFNLVKLPGIL